MKFQVQSQLSPVHMAHFLPSAKRLHNSENHRAINWANSGLFYGHMAMFSSKLQEITRGSPYITISYIYIYRSCITNAWWTILHICWLVVTGTWLLFSHIVGIIIPIDIKWLTTNQYFPIYLELSSQWTFMSFRGVGQPPTRSIYQP